MISKEEMLRTKEQAKGMLEWYLQSQGINTNKNFSCLSTDHSDSNPSMTFNKSTNTVYCFGCGEHGDIFDVIRMQYGIPKNDFKTIFETTYRVLGINTENFHTTENKRVTAPPKKKIEKTETKSEELNLSSFFKKAESLIDKTDYAQKRGLTDEVIKRFHLGFDPEWINPKLNEETKKKVKPSPRLIIPTSEHSYLARNTKENLTESEKKYSKMKVGKIKIFNEETLHKSQKPIFVVEGEIDAMSVIVAGGEAVALGSASNVDLFIAECKKNPPKVPLILCPDNDEAGKKAMTKLGTGLQKEKIPFVISNISGKYKDANERLVKDAEGFKNKVSFVSNRIKKIFYAKNKKNSLEEKNFNVGVIYMKNLESMNVVKPYKSLATALEKFDEDGRTVTHRDWQVNKGGYDLLFEIYHKGEWFANVTGSRFSNQYDVETREMEPLDKLGVNLVIDKFMEGHRKFTEMLTDEELKDFYNDDIKNFRKVFDGEEIISLLDKWKNECIENQDFYDAYDFAKKKDIETVHYKDIMEDLDLDIHFMEEVVKAHGTDTQTLNDAVDAVTVFKGEYSDFTAKLLQDTLNLPEYKKAFEAEQGKPKENTR